MKTYRIPQTDLTVSRIGLGCNQLITQEQDPKNADILTRADRLVQTALDQGVTLFDMAAMYSDGKVESVFGTLLKRSPGMRQKLIVQTKCGAVDNPAWKKVGDPYFLFDCSRQGILSSVDGSLARLGIDRIDILLLHWPDLLLQPEEVAAAFDQLHRKGKVRYFGVSNHTPGQMALLKKHVRQPLIINQMRLGLAASYPIAAGLQQLKFWGAALPEGPESLAGVVDYCRLNDMQIQTYYSVSGIMDYKLVNPPADATPQVKEASQILTDMAHEKGVSPMALGMAWLLHHPAQILPLTGAGKPEHIIDNCAGDAVALSREEWFRLFFAVASVQAAKTA